MIKIECNEGHCEIELNGSGALLTAEMQTVIHAVYNALINATPDVAHPIYANMYRLAVSKAVCDCIDT